MYLHELKLHHALAVCDHSFKHFVVQDFSIKDQSLKVSPAEIPRTASPVLQCVLYGFACSKLVTVEVVW